MAKSDGPKIIVQYRAKRGRVYELKIGEAVLSLHFSRAEEPQDSGEWHVAASANAGADAASAVGVDAAAGVDGYGATPAEALSEVARAWASRTPSLASFSWEAVTRELQVVQAV